MNPHTTELEIKVKSLLTENENEFSPHILNNIRKKAEEYLKEIDDILSTLSRKINFKKIYSTII